MSSEKDIDKCLKMHFPTNKKCFHRSLENLKSTTLCFCYEKSIQTRSIDVCRVCVPLFKNINKISYELVRFDVNKSSHESIEKSSQILPLVNKSDIYQGNQSYNNHKTEADSHPTDSKGVSTQITRLILIFEYLPLVNLIDVADSSKAFYTAACHVFEKKFRGTDILFEWTTQR